MKNLQSIYKKIQITCAFIFLIVFIIVPAPMACLASNNSSKEPIPKILILDDCDKDNDLRTSPFGDAVFLLNSNGELKQLVYRLQVIDSIGRCRNISVSEDGRFFVVCHDGAITMYETATGGELWPLQGRFWSVACANGLIYALDPENVYAINDTGTIVKHGRFGGLDIAIDTNNNCIWIVGLDIRKFSLDLKLDFRIPLTLSGSDKGAFSVDVCPDGSVWVAERDIHSKVGLKSRLLKVSRQGEVLKKIDINFSPYSICVDKTDGCLWATGLLYRDLSKIDDKWPETLTELYKSTVIESHTQKYDSVGNLLLSIDKGGYSIEIDHSDNSLWIAGQKSILHYSNKGEKLAEYTGFSEGQKWLAVISATSEEK